MAFEKLGYTLTIENTSIEFEWEEVSRSARGGVDWRIRLGGDGAGYMRGIIEDKTLARLLLGRELTLEEVKCAMLDAVREELLMLVQHARQQGARRTDIRFEPDRPVKVTLKSLKTALRMAVP